MRATAPACGSFSEIRTPSREPRFLQGRRNASPPSPRSSSNACNSHSVRDSVRFSSTGGNAQITVMRICLFAPSNSVRVFTVSESHQFPGLVIARPSKERPSGVTILAVLSFIYGASQGVGVFVGVPILFRGGGMLVYPVQALLVLLMLAFSLGESALLVAIGIGLIRLQNWARNTVDCFYRT